MVSILFFALKLLGLLVCLHLSGSLVSFLVFSMVFRMASKQTGDKYSDSVKALLVVCLITGWALVFKIMKKSFNRSKK